MQQKVLLVEFGVKCMCGAADLWLAALCVKQMEWRGILDAAPRVVKMCFPGSSFFFFVC